MSDATNLPIGDPPTQTRYDGWFGRLCKIIPLFDARTPGGWTLAYRSFTKTSWYHTETDVVLTVERLSDGWYVQVWDFLEDDRYLAVPTATSRWKAFDAAQQFLEGDDPLLPTDSSDWDGVLTLERVVDARLE